MSLNTSILHGSTFVTAPTTAEGASNKDSCAYLYVAPDVVNKREAGKQDAKSPPIYSSMSGSKAGK